LFSRFPFGTEMNQHEVVLAQALRALKDTLQSKPRALRVAAAALTHRPGDELRPYLKRMGLSHPRNAREFVYQRLLAVELRRLLETPTP
jgi:hypothetical protein